MKLRGATPAGAEATCAALLVGFANAIDQNDYVRVLSLFADDAVLQRPDTTAHGRDAISTLLDQRPLDRLTRHLCTNLEIAVQTDAHATGTAYVLFLTGPLTPDQKLPLPAPKPAMVEFHAEFSHPSGAWRIQTLRIQAVFQG